VQTINRNVVIGNHGYKVEVPDACPVCHRHSEIELIRGESTDDGAVVQVIFRCAYMKCRQFFFCYYGPKPQGSLVAVRPVKPQQSAFSDAVRAISPTFVSVFQEAEEAAANGLNQVAGPGYRKAFEFLIKDYAKSHSPQKAADIEGKFSGAVVNEYVPDKRIQSVAKRCLWLGNDETHYLKKWTQHDVTDLVALIKLVAHWIDIEQLSKTYVQQMPE
jgi:hypothetical protein